MKALFILFFFILKAHASGYPESYRYQVLVTDKTTSTVTKESFESIPKLILLANAKDLAKSKKEILIRTDWEKPFFTAWATHEGAETYALNFWGGIARIPGMNDEGQALIACHELGHVLGGLPRIKIKEFLWSSAEGQSDYYASGVCLKNYFSQQHLLKKLKVPKDVPGTSFTLCRTTYSEEKDFLICLNISKGIEAFRRLVTHLNGYKEAYDLEIPSKEIVERTLYDSYPDNQCRIDTLFQGSLCPLKQYPCEGKTTGARPLCWFRPTL